MSNLLHGQEQLGSNELFEGQTHLYKHVFNYISSMSLNCAVQLGIPDIIHTHGRPITLNDLVSSLQIHPSKSTFLGRLMSLLVHSGIFAKTQIPKISQEGERLSYHEEEAYVLTPTSKLLLKDGVIPNLSQFVTMMVGPTYVTSFHFLGNWFKEAEKESSSSSTPFEIAHGKSFWEFGKENPEFNDGFNGAMARDSEMMNLAVKDIKVVFEGLSSLVDVGGGTGKVARIISEAFPQLKCTVLDLPHVVANLEDIGDNLKFIGGDMFLAIPPADAVLLKLVLHDWSDEECLKVLKKCKKAIPRRGGKVIIIDIVMNEKNDDHQVTEVNLIFDVLMMTVVPGRERGQKDWERLFLEAGFNNYKITPMFGLRSLIEVFP